MTKPYKIKQHKDGSTYAAEPKVSSERQASAMQKSISDKGKERVHPVDMEYRKKMRK